MSYRSAFYRQRRPVQLGYRNNHSRLRLWRTYPKKTELYFLSKRLEWSQPSRWNNSWWFCFCSVIHNKWETLHVCAPCLNCSVSPSSGHELLGFSFFFFFLILFLFLFCINALLLALVLFFFFFFNVFFPIILHQGSAVGSSDIFQRVL